jgi:hypothetical protein
LAYKDLGGTKFFDASGAAADVSGGGVTLTVKEFVVVSENWGQVVRL